MIENTRADMQLLQGVLDIATATKEMALHLDQIDSKMPFESRELAAENAEIFAAARNFRQEMMKLIERPEPNDDFLRGMHQRTAYLIGWFDKCFENTEV